MLFCDFQSKLKKLNKDLFIDVENSRTPAHKDFPCAGLYIKNKRNNDLTDTRNYRYIMGVPHQYVPEYSIYGLEGERLKRYRKMPLLEPGRFLDQEWVDKTRQELPQAINDKPVWKGYRAILAELVSLGFIDKKRAERLFGIQIEPNRKTFPRRYLVI